MGQGSQWFSPTIPYLYAPRFSDVFINFILNVFTLLAFTQYTDTLNYSIHVFSSVNTFLCIIQTVTSCPQYLVTFLFESNIYISMYMPVEFH